MLNSIFSDLCKWLLFYGAASLASFWHQFLVLSFLEAFRITSINYSICPYFRYTFEVFSAAKAPFLGLEIATSSFVYSSCYALSYCFHFLAYRFIISDCELFAEHFGISRSRLCRLVEMLMIFW